MNHIDNDKHNSPYNYKEQRKQDTTRHITINHKDNKTQLAI
jgi:hypothetical protein